MSGWIPLVRVSNLWGLPHPSRVLWRLRVLIEAGVVEINETGDALRVNLPEDTLAVLREALHAGGVIATSPSATRE